MINFQKRKPDPLEIYQIAAPTMPWDIYAMANATKKAAAEARARLLHERLMALPGKPESNNKWTCKAGVSTSFFTNLQGSKKSPSEPTIGNLRAVLEVAGSSIPEFFLDEAEGRLTVKPSEQALEQAFAEAMDGMPRSPAGRPEYLSKVVLKLLQLPQNQLASPDTGDSEEQAAPEAIARTRRPTNRA